jgi:hypothetical protein
MQTLSIFEGIVASNVRTQTQKFICIWCIYLDISIPKTQLIAGIALTG